MTNQIIHSDFFTTNERVFNVSQSNLFEAWTNPQHLSQWWGPNGFTNTFEQFDLRPGGKWIFTMHGPDGKNYDNESEFVEITPSERIVFNHITAPQFQIVATFEKVSETQTKLTFKMVFEEENLYNNLKSFVLEKNEENFDRLENVLKNIAH